MSLLNRAATEPSRAAAPRPRAVAAPIVAAILLVVALAAAVSVDVVRTGFGIKGDEATYVAMALSAAYDRDLSYQRRDLERFWGLYRRGPEGLFLKRGQEIHVRFRGSPPYVRVTRVPDSRPDRLYFGKALIYPVAVAPFVRLLGMNGFLVFHVLLLFAVGVCGYLFLAARSDPTAALVYTTAFLGASVVPIYTVFLTPEIFNFSLVFFAYFLWLYKEVAPASRSRWLTGFGSDVCGAVLLGIVTYSKVSNAPLIAPLVLHAWWRRRFLRGSLLGIVFVVSTAALFGINALSSGELNYQGGDRKTFYSRFPFDAPDAAWERRGIAMTTNDSDVENVLAPSELINRFGLNVEYFLIGRHFGLVPYFFPGVLAIGLWLASRHRFEAWRLMTLVGFVASAVALLLFLPYTWSGGGGPPGNRYLLSAYPALFFLTPPLLSVSPGLIAWIGGALFTATMLVNPFVAAKFTYQATERGFARRLPVELTMANDLPIMLDPVRSRVLYGQPPLLLYFLDENAYPPDAPGIWVSGSGRADILVRSEQPLDRLVLTLESPIRTTVTASAGGPSESAAIGPGKPASVTLPARGVRGLQSYAYLLSVRSSDGFIPHLQDPASQDFRNLGALIRIQPVTAAGP